MPVYSANTSIGRHKIYWEASRTSELSFEIAQEDDGGLRGRDDGLHRGDDVWVGGARVGSRAEAASWIKDAASRVSNSEEPASCEWRRCPRPRAVCAASRAAALVGVEMASWSEEPSSGEAGVAGSRSKEAALRSRRGEGRK